MPGRRCMTLPAGPGRVFLSEVPRVYTPAEQCRLLCPLSRASAEVFQVD